MPRKSYQQVSLQLPCELVEKADCLSTRWGSSFRGRAHVIELALEIFMESNAPSYGQIKAYRRERLSEMKKRDKQDRAEIHLWARPKSDRLARELELLALCERLDRSCDGSSEIYPVSENDRELIGICAERFRALHSEQK